MHSPYFWLAVALLTALFCLRVWRRQDQRKRDLAERARLRKAIETPRPALGKEDRYVAGAFTDRWRAFKADRERSGRYRGERH